MTEATQERRPAWKRQLDRLLDEKLAGSAPRMVLTRWVYLRLYGLTAAVAIGSFWAQMRGLVGDEGIWPAKEQLAHWANGVRGLEAYLELPTLMWLSPGEGLLGLLCGLGVLLALLVTVGVSPRWALLSLWAVWLSIVSVGGPFLSFQWDILLVESAFASVFFAPNGLWPRLREEVDPPGAGTFLLRWLLMRLMLLSGLVKLLSGDPAWRDFTAFQYHYWTQPLPTWTSWYMHQAAGWFHTLSCLVMFAVELVLPLFAFGPRRLRLLTCAGFAFLQLALMATGNYSYFNLLTLVLCVPLLDDEALRKLLPERWRAKLLMLEGRKANRPIGLRVAYAAAAAVLVGLGVMAFVERLTPLPPALAAVSRRVQPFRTVNSYGAFAVMTKTRPEIELEASADGQTWKTYVFKYKPGPLERRPEFVAPWQPRLDWQMWFAALSSCEHNPWFLSFMRRLLEGKPEVAALLEENPFSDSPPRYVRSTVWQYRFSTPEEKRARNVWWERTVQGPYCPPVMMHEGRLVRADR